jgi:hypothetical protein
MTNASDARRSCPTRADGAEVLIAHTIPIATCQDRQRGMYHKCFACAYHGVGATMAPLRKLPQLADLEGGLRKVPRTAAVG